MRGICRYVKVINMVRKPNRIAIRQTIEFLQGLLEIDNRKPPTPKQKEILNLIQDSMDRNGYAPTLDEMAKELNRSRITIHNRIDSLKEKGYIANDSRKSRSWVLL